MKNSKPKKKLPKKHCITYSRAHQMRWEIFRVCGVYFKWICCMFSFFIFRFFFSSLEPFSTCFFFLRFFHLFACDFIVVVIRPKSVISFQGIFMVFCLHLFLVDDLTVFFLLFSWFFSFFLSFTVPLLVCSREFHADVCMHIFFLSLSNGVVVGAVAFVLSSLLMLRKHFGIFYLSALWPDTCII